MAEAAEPIPSTEPPKAEPPTRSEAPESVFTCQICLSAVGPSVARSLSCTAQPTEPMVTKCGHLFCWPCIYEVLPRPLLSVQWIVRNTKNNCPVCHSLVRVEELTPIYGFGQSTDPRKSSSVPQRPHQTTEAAPAAAGAGVGAAFGQLHFFGLLPGLFGMQFVFPAAPENASPAERRRAQIAQLSLLIPITVLLMLFLMSSSVY